MMPKIDPVASLKLLKEWIAEEKHAKEITAQYKINSCFFNKSFLKIQIKTKILFIIIRLKKNNQYGSYTKLNTP